MVYTEYFYINNIALIFFGWEFFVYDYDEDRNLTE